MKLRNIRSPFAARAFAALAACLSLFTLAIRPTAGQTSSSEPVVFVTVATPGTNAVWSGVEMIAEEMNYLPQVKAIRQFVESKQGKTALDGDSPVFIKVATDGSVFAPYARFAVASADVLTDDVLQAIRQTLVGLDKTGALGLDCFARGNELFITKADFKDLVFSIPASEYDASLLASENGTVLLTAEIALEKLPKEFVEAGAAFIRQKIAELSTDASDEDLARLNSALEYGYKYFDCIRRVKWSGSVGDDGGLVSKLEIALNSKTFVAEQLRESVERKTRWGAVANLPHTICATIESGVVPEESRKFNANYLAKMTGENHESVLDVLADDPENRKLAERLLELFRKAIVSDMNSGSFDGATVVLADPPALIWASDTTDPQSLREALVMVAERVKQDVKDAEKYYKADAEEYEGFTISKLDVPFSEIGAELIDYLAGKTLAARIAFSGDSVVAIAGLGVEEIDATLKKIIDGTKNPVAQPSASVFRLEEFASLASNILGETKDFTPETLASIRRVAEAKDATLTLEKSYADDVFTVKGTISGEVFRTLGDVLKIRSEGVGDGSEEDMNDIFDEE